DGAAAFPLSPLSPSLLAVLVLSVLVSLPADALCLRSASAAFLVSASISFFIWASRFSSQPFGSQSPGQPHFALFEHEQVLFDSFRVQAHLFGAARAAPPPSTKIRCRHQ